ncbi:MAG: RNA-binding domain-containing protein [Desulfosalsimonadaceae bacterium]
MIWSEKEIFKVIHHGESEIVEFKLNFDREAIETLCAFANTRGGYIFIGVTDAGEIRGIKIGKETIQNWINQVKLSTANSLIPDADVIQLNDKTVIVISTIEHPIKPIVCRGRYFKRVKNANHQMTTSEVANEHLKTFNSSWDFYTDEIHTLKDISLEKIRIFIDYRSSHMT